MQMERHQYIERDTGNIRTERLYADRIVNFMYNSARENAPILFRLFTSAWSSGVLGFVNFDLPLGRSRKFLDEWGIDLSECLDSAEFLNTPRRVFERKIRYEERRPMPEEHGAVVSPADARVIVGSFREESLLFLKGKFFAFEEILGQDKQQWLSAFHEGDFAVFRLTPDKYHYNHTPVAGRVLDIYEIPGGYHSCNPGAVITVATPYSKNKRVVTIIDTDASGGTGVGLVAMVEVVALMIGDIVQCYSATGYEAPKPVERGMFLEKGAPKSLYRPGSSTDILIFQRARISFAGDIVRNMRHPHATSRFSAGFGKPLAETELKVRSLLAVAIST